MKNKLSIFILPFFALTLSCGTQVVVPEYPKQSETVQTFQPEFSWKSASEKGAFEIQITNDILFSTLIEDVSDIKSSSYISKTMLQPGVYFYRVREKQSFGNGPWSEIITFTVESPGVEVLQPKNQQKITAGSEFSVSWKGVMNAEQYQIQLSGEKGFMPFLVNKTINDTVLKTILPEGIDNCYIRVRAKFKAGVETDWCKTVQIQPFYGYNWLQTHYINEQDKLVKLGDKGNVIKTISLQGHALVSKVGPQGEMVIFGLSNSDPHGNIWGICFDARGNTVWEQFYDYKELQPSAVCYDGKDILLIVEYGYDSYKNSTLLLKLDKSGKVTDVTDIEQERVPDDIAPKVDKKPEITSIEDKTAYRTSDIIALDEETYILCGEITFRSSIMKGSSGTTKTLGRACQVYALKNTGQMPWSILYFDDKSYIPYKLEKSSNSNVLLYGEKMDNPGNYWGNTSWLLEFDSKGDEKIKKEIIKNEGGSAIVKNLMVRNMHILAGESFVLGLNENNEYLFKNTIRIKEASNNEETEMYIHDLKHTSDGDFIVNGAILNGDACRAYWAAKLNYNCQEKIWFITQPENEPVDIEIDVKVSELYEDIPPKYMNEEEYFEEAEMPDEDELGIINYLCQSWTGNFGWWTFNQDHTYSYSYQDSYEGTWAIEGNTIVLDKETNPRIINFEDITENTLQLGEALLYEQSYYEELNKQENARRESLMQNTIPEGQWDKQYLLGEWATSEEGPDGGLMIFAFEGDAAYMAYDYNPEPGCWYIKDKKNQVSWYFDKVSRTIVINGNLFGSEEGMKVSLKITSLSHGAMKGYFTKETTTMFDEIENGPDFIREFYQADCK